MSQRSILREAIMITTTAATEEHRTHGERLVAKVRELIREGNVRRITIKNEDGRTLVELPLTVGVVGALMVPAWAAVGAVAAVVTDCSIEVERAEPGPQPERRAQEPAEREHPSRAAIFLGTDDTEGRVDREC
jgi:hypothetical protein